MFSKKINVAFNKLSFQDAIRISMVRDVRINATNAETTNLVILWRAHASTVVHLAGRVKDVTLVCRTVIISANITRLFTLSVGRLCVRSFDRSLGRFASQNAKKKCKASLSKSQTCRLNTTFCIRLFTGLFYYFKGTHWRLFTGLFHSIKGTDWRLLTAHGFACKLPVNAEGVDPKLNESMS